MFPFSLPGSTQLYLLLFVATLVVHFVLMSYVLAGSVWGLLGLFVPGRRVSPTVSTLQDWMPFMLSGAITAGVAPLLFIQILYRPQFYTANLLQFHRWMIILPVLIVLFYLSYVVKALRNRRSLLQQVAAGTAVLCVLFVAWSWSGNHVLSLESPDAWREIYAGQNLSLESAIWSRLFLWISLTFPVLCCLLSWQMRMQLQESSELSQQTVRWTSLVALTGIAATVVSGGVWWNGISAETGFHLLSSGGRLWGVTAAVGTACQLAGWSRRFSSRTDTLVTRLVVSGGALLQLTAMMMLREQVRIIRLGDRVPFQLHEDAADAQGMPLFLLFCAVNAAVAGWCIHLVRTPEPSDAPEL